MTLRENVQSWPENDVYQAQQIAVAMDGAHRITAIAEQSICHHSCSPTRYFGVNVRLPGALRLAGVLFYVRWKIDWGSDLSPQPSTPRSCVSLRTVSLVTRTTPKTFVVLALDNSGLC